MKSEATVHTFSRSIAWEVGPQGIHVAYVVIDGQIDIEKSRVRRPDRDLKETPFPDSIPETYWQLPA